MKPRIINGKLEVEQIIDAELTIHRDDDNHNHNDTIMLDVVPNFGTSDKWPNFELNYSEAARVLNSQRRNATKLLTEDLPDYGAVFQQQKWSKFFERVAGAMTNMLQSTASPNHVNVTGWAMRNETRYQVRWEWFIMPLLLVLLSAVFLVLTAWKSTKKPYLFKNSNIALLADGLDGWNADEWRKIQGEIGLRQKETDGDLLKLAVTYRATFGRNTEGDLMILKAE
ncbi:hypothetical protein BU24DRAFT_467165 [Aaosphaeria arxii CBS 175.79]|uniref:Uncharacterized protein n=1 Tax=Aaosphaeria arxii CBS 175.79 TaxID=1450172 RepID=A0A6A5XCK6_9PLEO|nr:uncharacterized protein BU24DRAFT_467165 [Aaosphaeria arxii CBS 175.79]KAF2010546.1 hypothetical protein BU24DRAFT_467165 [Aaosphaeria arxii CBS 175.79]